VKRVASLAITGIVIGYWYPTEAAMVGAGTLLGWFVIPQPDFMVTMLDKAKELLNS
jgi:hypothetical protein